MNGRSQLLGQFSFQSRQTSLKRFKEETFDVLIIGGGITGAATARDAASRGLKVAVVEKNDFAFGTSSRSSKLIHGGLRYLQNFEFHLVFESLSERALLLKTVPHLVRPLPFFLPVYDGDANGKGILSLGLWLYDMLSLFRAPGFHRRLSRDSILQSIPFLKKDGLQGGFRYFDASMWDDVLAVETLRSAHHNGVAIANYCEAVSPIWNTQEIGGKGDRVIGYTVRDLENKSGGDAALIEIKARSIIICTGPWTDHLGKTLTPKWNNWLNPSKGVHLIFDLKRVPVPGAMVMSQQEDGRIAFVIPRPDYGAGVVIVGTTDGPTPAEPEKAEVDKGDVDYLLGLLNRYFPDLNLTASDILSAYVGVRPLIGNTAGTEGQDQTAGKLKGGSSLQKVSREHHIDVGHGGVIVVAGGKYTTARKMAEQIVDFTLKHWREHARKSHGIFPKVGKSSTRAPINPRASREAIEAAKQKADHYGVQVPVELFARYGDEALDILELTARSSSKKDPDGFPKLEAQLRHSIRNEMVMHLEDFYLRRLPLFASRADHTLPWAEQLARVWAEEMGFAPGEIETQARAELARLQAEIERRSASLKAIQNASR